jgi:hypothetical protein
VFVHVPLFANAHHCPVWLTFGGAGSPKKRQEILENRPVAHKMPTPFAGGWPDASPRREGAVNANEIYLQNKTFDFWDVMKSPPDQRE